MSQIITATFEDGMLKPDALLDLPSAPGFGSSWNR
jgi:predicted DNA-binding antitoxin AbrB/MazE fold protein